MSTAFDTLAATKRLREAGLAEQQAEAIAIKDGQGELATGSDIALLRSEIASLRSGMMLLAAIALANTAGVIAILLRLSALGSGAGA